MSAGRCASTRRRTALDQVRMVIIGMDPPEHREFRAIVSKAFTPKMIASSASRCGPRRPGWSASCATATSCEFVTDVAARIPMWSISELMGVPRRPTATGSTS